MSDIQLIKDLATSAAGITHLSSASGAFQFEGWASLYGVPDDEGDIVMPGAFDQTLKNRTRPIMMFFGHSPGRVPGKWISAESSSHGLRMRGELTPGHSEASDLAASIRHESIGGLSIAGSVPMDASKVVTRDGNTYRELHKINLREVSIVSNPAQAMATVDMDTIKSLSSISSIRDLERLLRAEFGLSAAAAKLVISKCKQLSARDAPTEIPRDEGDSLTQAIHAMRERLRGIL